MEKVKVPILVRKRAGVQVRSGDALVEGSDKRMMASGGIRETSKVAALLPRAFIDAWL